MLRQALLSYLTFIILFHFGICLGVQSSIIKTAESNSAPQHEAFIEKRLFKDTTSFDIQRDGISRLKVTLKAQPSPSRHFGSSELPALITKIHDSAANANPDAPVQGGAVYNDVRISTDKLIFWLRLLPQANESTLTLTYGDLKPFSKKLYSAMKLLGGSASDIHITTVDGGNLIAQGYIKALK